MKKKLLILLAVAALVATVIAAPAGAFRRQSLRGYQGLDFNLGIVTGEGFAPKVSWVGTVDFRGGTYDIVYRPTAPLVEHGDWIYFEENVRIYEPGTLSYNFDGNGVIDAFTEGNVVVEFNERGWLSPRGTGFAWGKVITANGDPGGVLDNVAKGDRIFWYGGYLDETHMTWGGPFRIFTRG